MKIVFKGFRVILVIAISFSILIFSAYACYYTVAAADFLSPDLNFETYDQEFLFAAYENELKELVPGSFFNGSHLITDLFGQPSYFFLKMPSLDQETLILRC